MSIDLKTLPDIVFAGKDAQEISSAIIGGFEGAYEKQYGVRRVLAPGDPVRLFLLAIADVIIQQRNLIDYAGKMNLLAYAIGGFLDHIVALVGVSRLPPSTAMTTMRFTLSAPQTHSVIIPAGIRVTAGDRVYFAPREPVEILSGHTVADVLVVCTETGALGNGYLPGQIKGLVDPLPWIQSVENTTISAGGADTEDDEHLRERGRLAPEAFSNAGSYGAYRFWAMSAHQDVVDVAVIGPPEIDLGCVELYPLMSGGVLPTEELLNLILAACNADDVRPLTDHVSAHSPVEVMYVLKVAYWIERDDATQANAIKAAVERAASEWVTWQRSKIGRDIVPSRLIQMIMAAGAKRVEVISPPYQVLGGKELAILSGESSVLFGGIEDG